MPLPENPSLQCTCHSDHRQVSGDWQADWFPPPLLSSSDVHWNLPSTCSSPPLTSPLCQDLTTDWKDNLDATRPDAKIQKTAAPKYFSGFHILRDSCRLIILSKRVAFASPHILFNLTLENTQHVCCLSCCSVVLLLVIVTILILC